MALFPLSPHLIAMKWWDQMPSQFFEYRVLSQLFHSPLSLLSRGSLGPLCFLPLGWYHQHIGGCQCFSHQSWFQILAHPAQYFTWCTLIMQVVQSCLTLRNPKDCIVHGILKARILEWVAIPLSRGSSQPRDRIQVSSIAGRFFTNWATKKAHYVLCIEVN